ncbi:MAG: hypothetical protein J7K33_11290 [Candidatus Marinimicrobia bacterium]|nr:hypothetical protein [Candidatus Neomarinimicrobiota bacterium]
MNLYTNMLKSLGVKPRTVRNYYENIQSILSSNCEKGEQGLVDFQDFFKSEIPPDCLKLKALIELIKEEANRQLSYYRQRKEDLIARMATDWPRWGCGLDFFTFFIQPLLKNPFLLHFINLSDDVGLSQIDIKLGYNDEWKINWVKRKINLKYDQNSTEINNPNLVDYGISLLKEIKTDRTKLQLTSETENLKSFLVRVRDADIGAQAFFSFFEGTIRNAAKHRIHNEGQKDQLEARFVFCEDAKSLKNLFNSDSELLKISEDRKFCYVLLSINTDKLRDAQGKERTIKAGDKEKPIIDYIRDHLNEPVIDDTGQLTPGNWGLKEMKICAAFLSGANLEEVNSVDPNYLWITKSPSKIWGDGEERFAYIIRLEKSRYVLAVVDDKPSNLREWENRGIKVINPGEIEKVILDYDFLYLGQGIQLPDKLNALLPQRKVENNHNLSEFDSEPMNLLYKVYDLHLNELIGGNKYKICIYFEDDQKATQWSEWWNGTNKPEGVEFVFPQQMDEADNIMGKPVKEDGFRKIGILRHRGIASLIERNETRYYQEFATYSDLFFSFLYNIRPDNLGSLVIRQLIESTVMNVLVIDERIAQVLPTAEVQDADGKVKLENKLYWMGIYVAKSVKIKGNSYNYIREANSERMKEVDLTGILNRDNKFQIEKNGFLIHILLIHATRLNEIAKDLDMANVDLIKKLKAVIPYVIVHSGRGKTKGDIPYNAPFVEYSIIQRYLLQEPSKFFLVQVALSAKGGN